MEGFRCSSLLEKGIDHCFDLGFAKAARSKYDPCEELELVPVMRPILAPNRVKVAPGIAGSRANVGL